MTSYNQDNVFAKIIVGDIPAEKIYEDDYVVAFNDISQAAPVHVLVIPKGEYLSFDDFTQNATPDEIANFFKTVKKVANQLSLEDDGYRIITNHGKNASQTVPHFHVHILGGKQLGGLLA